MGGWCGAAERMHNLGPACQSWDGKEGDLSFSAVFLRQKIYFWELTKQLPKLKKLEKQTVVKTLQFFSFLEKGVKDEDKLELLFQGTPY